MGGAPGAQSYMFICMHINIYIYIISTCDFHMYMYVIHPPTCAIMFVCVVFSYNDRIIFHTITLIVSECARHLLHIMKKHVNTDGRSTGKVIGKSGKMGNHPHAPGVHSTKHVYPTCR